MNPTCYLPERSGKMIQHRIPILYVHTYISYVLFHDTAAFKSGSYCVRYCVVSRPIDRGHARRVPESRPLSPWSTDAQPRNADADTSPTAALGSANVTQGPCIACHTCDLANLEKSWMRAGVISRIAARAVVPHSHPCLFPTPLVSPAQLTGSWLAWVLWMIWDWARLRATRSVHHWSPLFGRGRGARRGRGAKGRGGWAAGGSCYLGASWQANRTTMLRCGTWVLRAELICRTCPPGSPFTGIFNLLETRAAVSAARIPQVFRSLMQTSATTSTPLPRVLAQVRMLG